ncbi:DUF3892 domain-containing protein [Altererythrobacter xixiisoli]|uniref:DUF3892 domain-containing protein n=1 Tax=Croceibacterium xixiisoli TaxID=1476466 RepID=A0A6I4TX77_9SPHN|nr:DUF3892 domain-containing protein [Croceibacterium xixiisoli]
MADHQITRTRKDGPDADRRIDACEVGGHIYGTDDIISFIENRTHTFFTNYGRRADVYVRVRNNRKYLTTSADGYGQNNLLLLPDC